MFIFFKKIVLFGSINSLQENLFLNFDFVQSFHLKLYNLKNFIHQGLKWLDYLKNKKRLQIVIRFQNYQIFFNDIYKFPNEEFCIFNKSILIKD